MLITKLTAFCETQKKARHEAYPNSDKFIPKTITHLNIILLSTLKPLKLPIPFVPATTIFIHSSASMFLLHISPIHSPIIGHPILLSSSKSSSKLLMQFFISSCHFLPLRHTGTPSSEALKTWSHFLSLK
jgi:hypothetical protein